MREQRVILEHHADAALLGRHAVIAAADQPAVEPDLAARDRLEAGDAPEHRGFAAAARAEQAADVAALQRKRNAVQHRGLPVCLRHAVERDYGVALRRGFTAVDVHVRAL